MTEPASVTPSPRLGVPHALLIAAMFLVSGASALIYEVVWTRQLTTLFGATHYSVATVLTAFMGGLALGSWLFGRLADRFQRPLLVFGILELFTAAAAAAFPFVLNFITPIVGKFYATGGEGTFLIFSLVRFVLAGSLLLVPTTLMGATLPVLSKAVTRDLRFVGRSVGGLYAINTLGAVTGVFLSGFMLIEKFGIWKTTLIAVAGDSLVGIGAIVLGLGLRVAIPTAGDSLPASQPLYPLRTVRLILATYFLSGFIALCYQIAWTRSLLFGFETLKATTYSFAAMLTVFLLGLAIGSSLMQAFVDRIRDLLAAYGALQLILGVWGALTPFLIMYQLPETFETLREGTTGDLNYWGAIGNVMVRTTFVIGVPTLVMGMLFPVVARMATGSLEKLGKDIGTVYALNTCGAIAGSFLGGFFLIPHLGVSLTISILAGLNLLIVAAVIGEHPTVAPKKRPYLLVGYIVVVALFIGTLRGRSQDGYFHPLTLGEQMVYYNEGSLATVSVIEDSKGWRTIYVDAIGVAGTDPVLQTDQKSLAHVPMVLLGGRAESVLTVGFGSGGASYSYTLYPEVENIHAIEITTNVPKAAPSLTAANHGILYTEDDIVSLADELAPGDLIPGVGPKAPPSARPLADYTHTPAPGFRTFDPRYRLIIDDARSYLRFTDVSYDVIATDCTDLRYKSNANLYDLEYFELCRERISDRGLVVVWMPLAGLSDEAFRIVVRTFHAVFPEMTVWYFTNEPTHYCLFIGQKGPLAINYADVVKALEIPAIQDDMNEIGLRDPAKLVSCFVTDNRGIDTYVGDGPLNTEDFPIIEFLSPRYGYDSRPIAENMGRLYDVQTSVWDRIVDQNDERARRDREKMAAYQQANDILFQGHAQYRLFNFGEACRYYMQARDIAPSDDSINRLLEFEELRLLLDAELERNPASLDLQWINAQWIAYQLGSVYIEQHRYQDAATVVGPFVRRIPAPSADLPEEVRDVAYALNRLLAECYSLSGNVERGAQYMKEAEAYRAAK
ncbi:MAG: spermidine synthase [Candidatus Sumerlaeota bacterium]|nr:spermidine synthase [Candidatus Sumerlaeota bacterium]